MSLPVLTYRGLETIDVLAQQCGAGNERDYPEQCVIHNGHEHETKHGRKVWCRGWFPKVSVARGGIQYPRSS